METIRLSSGYDIPQLGLGVYMMSSATCTRAVLDAIELGYRHIDTAQIYQNEKAVGDAIVRCGVPREELFITSKVWASNYGYDKCRASIDRSLARLQTSYIDLMLLHRPFGDMPGAWRALEDAVAEGRIRSIGLSNILTEVEWNSIVPHTHIPPAVNQIEAHPYEQRAALKEKMAAAGMALEAWYPLGHGSKELLQEPTILDLARAHGCSPVQIILRWHIQQGHIIFPKSASREHLQQNLAIFDFSLTTDEMARMTALDRRTELYRSSKLMDTLTFRFMKV